MSVGDIGLLLVVVAAGAIVLAMFYGAEEVQELQWKKRKAIEDLEAMRHEEADKARQGIIDVLNDEGMK